MCFQNRLELAPEPGSQKRTCVYSHRILLGWFGLAGESYLLSIPKGKKLLKTCKTLRCFNRDVNIPAYLPLQAFTMSLPR